MNSLTNTLKSDQSVEREDGEREKMAEEVVNIETTFGVNAGKVWNALNKIGTATPRMIQNETKLTSDEVHGALGWLAREGKITQIRDGKLVKFRLVDAPKP